MSSRASSVQAPEKLDGAGDLSFGLMFTASTTPTNRDHKLHARFWRPTLTNGALRFPRPEECTIRKFVRDMTPKRFGIGENVKPVSAEADEWGA